MLSRVLTVIVSVGWVIYLGYTVAALAAAGVAHLPATARAAVATLLTAVTVAVLVERAVERVRATAGARYRDGYADGYVDGVTDRRPAPERTLRSVR